MWTLQRLTWLGMFMAWEEGQTLTARWQHAATAAAAGHRHWRLGRSYTGFTQALLCQTPRLTAALKERFRRQMRQQAGPSWTCRGWTALAVDGTRLEAPHCAANEAGLGCAGRDTTAVRVDLSAVTFIDAAGKELLAAMHSQGAEFVCAGCLMRAVVAEITRAPVCECGESGEEMETK